MRSTDVSVDEAMSELRALVQLSVLDKTSEDRRLRYAKLAHTIKKLKKAINKEHPIQNVKKKADDPRELAKRLMEKGWVLVENNIVIDRLLRLKTKQVVRRWYDPYRTFPHYLCVAPAWAAAIAQHLPEKLEEAYRSRSVKRQALRFQAEAVAAKSQTRR